MSDVPERPKSRRHTKEEMDAMVHFMRGFGEVKQFHEDPNAPWPIICPACGGDGVYYAHDEGNNPVTPFPARFVKRIEINGVRCREYACHTCDGRGTVIA